MFFSFVLRLVVFSVLALQVLGQNSIQTFNWKFRTDFVSTRLPVCHDLPLIVFATAKNASTGNFFSGIPPYYMLAFPQGGQPITFPLGDNNDTLSWTPTHPVGTKIILQVMDSQGNTGGTGSAIYEIIENPQANSNSCIAPSPPSDFTITSNKTQDGKSTLETCEPWRLDIIGGNPPYTVVLDARSSPVITNITVPPGDDAVVFIDRADPGTVLFASVVDSLGRWANGTQFVSTIGSTDVTCTGLVTVSKSQAELNQQEAQQKAARNAKRRTSIIVGVVVSLVSVLLIVGGVGAWLHMRRKKAMEVEEAGQDILPRQFVETGPSGQVLSINSFMGGTSTTPSPGKSTFSPGLNSLSYATETLGESMSMDSDPNRMSSGSSHVPGANLRSRPSFANFPATSVRRSKAQEAAQDATSDSDGAMLMHSQSAMATSSAGHPVWPARSASLQANATSPVESEIIYQHQDAGQVVRELPPPYIAPPDVVTPGGSERRA